MPKCVFNPNRGRNKAYDFVAYWCQGCNQRHQVTVNANGTWVWNGDVNAPTFSPSVKVTWTVGRIEMKPQCCHSFVRDGRIEFLSDCTHAFSGQTVDMVEVDANGYALSRAGD